MLSNCLLVLLKCELCFVDFWFCFWNLLVLLYWSMRMCFVLYYFEELLYLFMVVMILIDVWSNLFCKCLMRVVGNWFLSLKICVRDLFISLILWILLNWVSFFLWLCFICLIRFLMSFNLKVWCSSKEIELLMERICYWRWMFVEILCMFWIYEGKFCVDLVVFNGEVGKYNVVNFSCF